MRIYRCIKDYCPVRCELESGDFTLDKTSILEKGDFLLQEKYSVLFQSMRRPQIKLYEHTICMYKECFRLIKKN